MSVFDKTYSPSEVLRIIAKTSFRHFNKSDWEAFSGCESDDPLIGEFKFCGFTGVIIIDDERVELINNNGSSAQTFSLKDPESD